MASFSIFLNNSRMSLYACAALGLLCISAAEAKSDLRTGCGGSNPDMRIVGCGKIVDARQDPGRARRDVEAASEPNQRSTPAKQTAGEANRLSAKGAASSTPMAPTPVAKVSPARLSRPSPLPVHFPWPVMTAWAMAIALVAAVGLWRVTRRRVDREEAWIADAIKIEKNSISRAGPIPIEGSSNPMTRGEKLVSIKIGDKVYNYLQPGWWRSLSDPADMRGQLVDSDSEIADMARRTAKALAHGEKVFVPVVIRAIRQRCGLTQCEAGLIFGTDETSFAKYESGESQPSAPTKRLLKLAMERPKLFRLPRDRRLSSFPDDNVVLARKALRAVHVDRLYGPLFEER